jgi:hypothetical protein
VSRTIFVPAAADLPPNTDLDSIVAELSGDHVAAPAADEDKLVAIVNEARNEGIQLSIVVIPKNPHYDSQLRDLATEVAKTEHGTVLVLSPDWVGTYSDTISRVRLESAEDAGKWTGGNSSVAAQKFVDGVTQPGLPWTAITCVVVAATASAVAGLYFVKARRARTSELGNSVTDSVESLSRN